MKKIRWGVLGAARDRTHQGHPGHAARPRKCEVTALASRSLETARATAAALGIPKAYGSYEELLADPDVDAVYNPLPNHLHVPWSIKAAEAGKHVLCEKPIALDRGRGARPRRRCATARASSSRRPSWCATHPQWLAVRDDVRAGRIGELRAIQMAFSYFNRDPANVRNQAGIGGGALMDIGCYPIVALAVPVRGGARARDRQHRPRPGVRYGPPDLRPARVPQGQCVFTCCTQLVPYQRDAGAGARRGASRSRSRSTRRPTGRAGSSSTTDATRSGSGVESRVVRGLRPVHAAGRGAVARDPGRRGGAGAPRGRGREHASHRRAGALGTDRTLGKAVTVGAVDVRDGRPT